MKVCLTQTHDKIVFENSYMRNWYDKDGAGKDGVWQKRCVKDGVEKDVG